MRRGGAPSAGVVLPGVVLPGVVLPGVVLTEGGADRGIKQVAHQKYVYSTFVCGVLFIRISTRVNAHHAKSRGGGLKCAHLRATPLQLTGSLASREKPTDRKALSVATSLVRIPV
jgi:hypothetical protein